MPWPVHPNGLLGAQGDSDSYKIERSLRFNSADSAYLNRTISSTSNQKTYTFNFWVKRSQIAIGTDVEMFSAVYAATSLRYAYIAFEAGDTMTFYSGIYSTGASTTTSYQYTTTQVFRDPSAWYMITCVADTTNPTASERIKIYVNGVQVTSFSVSTQPSLNQNGYWNASTAFHGIGTFNASSGMFPGYLAEINFIDGQALTPSSFGETDVITGRWKAKAYSGSYGTNGYYLKFADNSGTTATTLGKDSSGNGNNWTPNNFSVDNTTGNGVGNDSLVDSPTNYGLDTGLGGEVRGNYCTFNPLKRGSTYGNLSNGNLTIAGTTGAAGQQTVQANIAMSSGKWYAEAIITTLGAESAAGVAKATEDTGLFVGRNAGSYGYYYTGSKYNNNSATSYGSSYTTGDVIGVAFDADLGELVFYKNGASQGTAFTGLTSGPYVFEGQARSATSANNNSWNFGQRPWKYAAPSGFKALCTHNLTQPTIQKPSKFMDALAYTGTGASNSISSFGFSPDLVWIKNRGTTTSHAIYDTTRGAQKQLSSDTTGDEATSSTGLTSFDSNGFTIGTSTLVNTNGTQYAAWAWDESNQAGLDIISYTGNGSNRTISHNLGVAPRMIIVKARTTAGADQGWPVWHTSIANTTYLALNSTNATASGVDYWNSTSPTSSVFSVGTNSAVNANNDTYIAYAFSEVEGFSKFGSYTGNGSADGPFVWCGFRPRWILFKCSTDGNSVYSWWGIYDSTRDTFNVFSNGLFPNLSNAELTSAFGDMLSNGFKLRNSSAAWNGSGQTYIFAAFAEAPFKYARAR